MLVNFSFSNYKSFFELNSLSLQANKISEYKEENVFNISDQELLKSAVIYGANASGKSNIIKALRVFRRKLIMPLRLKENDYYKLNTEGVNCPMTFEMEFIINGIFHKYGFSIKDNIFQEEWLFMRQKKNLTRKFHRKIKNNSKDYEYITSKEFSDTEGIQEKTREDVPFLYALSQWNNNIARDIVSWIEDFFIIDSYRGNSGITEQLLDEPEFKKEIMYLMKVADLGIIDIKNNWKNLTENELSEEFKILKNYLGKEHNLSSDILKEEEEKFSMYEKNDTSTVHKVFDMNKMEKGYTEFSLKRDESLGTNTYFNLIGIMLLALKQGRVLIIDEIGTNLHPLIVNFILNIFNSEKYNPNNSQLLFTTHNIQILSNGNFRRDQIYFVEKDRFGESSLYSLNDINGVRKNTNFMQEYLKGKYGSVPVIMDQYLDKINFRGDDKNKGETFIQKTL